MVYLNKLEDVTNLLPEYKVWVVTQKDITSETAQKHVYVVKKYYREAGEFSKKSFRQWLYDKRENKKASTREKYCHALRVFCDFLVEKDLIEANWAREIPVPKREKTLPTVLSISEIDRLLSVNLERSYIHYDDPEFGENLYNTIFSVLAKTGARIGEVLSIKINDIDFEEGTWKLNHTKTKRGRLIPVPPDDLKIMKQLAGNRDPKEYIFINPLTDKKMRRHQVENNFRLRLAESGIKKDATVHTLRHSFITELLRQDVSVLKIANLVGHENITTTQGYAKLLYEDLRDAIMRHPMTARNRNPWDIIKHIKDTLTKFHLKDDPRFFFEMSEGNDGLRITIFIR